MLLSSLLAICRTASQDETSACREKGNSVAFAKHSSWTRPPLDWSRWCQPVPPNCPVVFLEFNVSDAKDETKISANLPAFMGRCEFDMIKTKLLCCRYLIGARALGGSAKELGHQLGTSASYHK